MPPTPSYALRQLRPGDTGRFRALLTMFGEVFGDTESYLRSQPSDAPASMESRRGTAFGSTDSR